MTVTKPVLYSRDILRLATELPHDDAIENPHGRACVRAPLCGSEIAADVTLDVQAKVVSVAFRAHACALGQASAAILRSYAPGLDMTSIVATRAALQRFLFGDETPLLWAALHHFHGARAHAARHGAILLPYDALLAAIADARR
jgi:NifU-like protein involved in Fe-S cluster formation